jgi:hypothetical protein
MLYKQRVIDAAMQNRGTRSRPGITQQTAWLITPAPRIKNLLQIPLYQVNIPYSRGATETQP